jgi:biotin operon repressor
MGKPSTEAYEKKRQLAHSEEKELELLLDCVNTEPKAATLCVVQTGRAYLQGDLREELARYGPVPERSSFGDFCLKSFTPAGIVEIRKVTVRGNANARGYFLTEKGARIARKIGIAALRLTAQTQIPLRGHLGKQGTGGEHDGPYNRFRTLETLAIAPLPLRLQAIGYVPNQTAIGEWTGIDPAVLRKHLQDFEEMGYLIREPGGYVLTERSQPFIEFISELRNASIMRNNNGHDCSEKSGDAVLIREGLNVYEQVPREDAKTRKERLFAEVVTSEGISASQLAHRTRMPYTTVHKTIQELLHEGCVVETVNKGSKMYTRAFPLHA